MSNVESDRDCFEFHHICPKCHNKCHKDCHKCPGCNHDFHHDCC